MVLISEKNNLLLSETKVFKILSTVIFIENVQFRQQQKLLNDDGNSLNRIIQFLLCICEIFKHQNNFNKKLLRIILLLNKLEASKEPYISPLGNFSHPCT